MLGGTPSHKVDAPKPKKFKGARSKIKVDNFLWEIEQYFCAMGIKDDDPKVNTTSLHLTDFALLWWRHGSTNVRHVGIRIGTWKEFQKEFKTQFYPEYAENEVWDKFHQYVK